jgi:DNA-binding transcriptional MerR regulator
MTIGELSRRVDVAPDRLRAWERRYGLLRPRRSSGNYRLYSKVDEARIRLMRRYLDDGVPAAQAAELAVGARFAVRAGDHERMHDDEAALAIDEMRASLDAFDETSAQRILEQLFAAYTPTTVIRDVLLPYLYRVGERWADGHLTVAQEHFATSFLQARLLALARGWDRGLGPRALLAAAPGEQHVCGLIAFGVALHQLGWRITYLGADTPWPMVASAAGTVAPDVVVVSAAMQGRVRETDAREVAARWPLALAGAGCDPDRAARIGARCLEADPVSAAVAVAAMPSQAAAAPAHT